METTEMPERALPPTGYSLQQVEQVMGWPRRTAYRKVKEGKLPVFEDSLGLMKVHPYTLWKMLEEQDKSK